MKKNIKYHEDTMVTVGMTHTLYKPFPDPIRDERMDTLGKNYARRRGGEVVYSQNPISPFPDFSAYITEM